MRDRSVITKGQTRERQMIDILRHDGHEWVTFPRMKRGEAVAMKAFDCRPEKRSRFAAHCAFEHPLPVSPHAPPRRSCDIRCIVCYDDKSAFEESFWTDLEKNFEKKHIPNEMTETTTVVLLPRGMDEDHSPINDPNVASTEMRNQVMAS